MKVVWFMMTASLGLCAVLALPLEAPTADKEPLGKEAEMDRASDLAAYLAEDGSTLNVFSRNAEGAILELFRKAGKGDDKVWHSNDLTAEAKAPKAASGPSAYSTKKRVGKSISHHVLYRSSDNQIHELYRSADGKWEHNNLSAATKAPKAAGHPAAFFSDDPAVHHVVYRTAEGALIDLSRANEADAKWLFNDLTADAKAPKAAGNPCGYLERAGTVTTTTTHHVLYRGEDGHIHELWVGDKPGKWQHNDLTAEAKGPKAAGDPCAYPEQKDDVQHVFYRTSEGAIIDLHRNRAKADDNKWHSNDLTAEAKAKAAKAAGNPGAYLEQTGKVKTAVSQHVVYRGEDSQVQELYLRPKQDRWMHNNLSTAGKAPKAADDPKGFAEGDIQHVFYRTSTGDVYELYYIGEGDDPGWHSHNLTKAVKKPK